ncbi:hypothetical protein [Paraburkholderia rhizosphaerae]|uniref:Uncharacterized protein n=1 Tax=Paraburkholderia rhizosphaerae TaxID=480658 RepID=A0A4V3HEC9_9BURK|nr:hypothetical protein [Paraburkholderia rhizosphaerae]TDY46478.1 hypothetical protein BX592_113106 [Paraburkholderia rhizosphaerae]
MNKYLSRLRPGSNAAKPVPSSVGFVSAPGSRAQKNASPDAPGEFWPWAPYLAAADVQRMRTELVGIIERLADMEHWPAKHRDDVLARAIRGPLADLLPNVAHFNERLMEANAAAAAREAVKQNSWRSNR